ncbi:MAG: hypothetical protein APF84_02830 [Gracilibacter sp. BRH_c7a]|nr:MAG: hypothetical protein APF84_02830 [Gracilibacter sp. BRH_c7a]
MRLFISINLNDANLVELEKWQNKLRSQGVGGYWRRRDNLHITLKFFDNVQEQNVDPLVGVLKQAAVQGQEFKLIIKTLGVFPNLNNPRILWAGINKEPNLFKLQQEVEIRCKEIGFPLEHREYKPHLTLASGGIKGINKTILEEGQTLELEQKITEFHLMSSIVEQGRRSYEVVKRFNLKKN